MEPRGIDHRRAGSALLLVFALAACAGGQSTDDAIPGGSNDNKQGDRKCVPDRSSLPDPDGSHRQSLAWLEQSYPIAGRFGAADVVGMTPADVSANGDLVVELASGELTRLTGCRRGVEARVDLQLRTDDGALDERLAGKIVVPAELLEPPEPDVFYDHIGELEAEIDLTALHGDLHFDEESEWTLTRGLLRASLSPFGSHGELVASAEQRNPPELKKSESLTAPASDPLLRWPTDSSCGESEPAWTPTDSEPANMLAARIAQLAKTKVAARYVDDPAAAETELTIEIEPPSDLCGYARRTSRAHVHSADERIDLQLDVAIDLGYPSPLFFNTNYEIENAYTPSVFVARVGHVDAELDEFAHVGVEIWFDQNETTQGELKLLGWAAGDCLLCDADACNECSAERRTVILSLALGACPEGSTASWCMLEQ